MNKDRIAGVVKEFTGSVKATIGRGTGDAKLAADGNAEKVEGKAQNAVGGLKDALIWLRKDTQNDNRLQHYGELGLLGCIPDGDRDHAGRSRADGHGRGRGGYQWSAD
jgi:uncharacterized protein YjbJ (UPF0337 family)